MERDEALVKAAQAGNLESFDRLVELYHARLLGWAFTLVRDAIAAQDIVQEAFLRAFSSVKVYDPRLASVKTWLFAIVRNCAREWIRKQRSSSRLAEMELSKIGEFDYTITTDQTTTILEDEQEERIIALQVAVEELSIDERKALMLKYWNNLSCNEISKKLNKPIGTVMSMLSRVYKKIRESMEERT